MIERTPRMPFYQVALTSLLTIGVVALIGASVVTVRVGNIRALTPSPGASPKATVSPTPSPVPTPSPEPFMLRVEPTSVSPTTGLAKFVDPARAFSFEYPPYWMLAMKMQEKGLAGVASPSTTGSISAVESGELDVIVTTVAYAPSSVSHVDQAKSMASSLSYGAALEIVSVGPLTGYGSVTPISPLSNHASTGMYFVLLAGERNMITVSFPQVKNAAFLTADEAAILKTVQEPAL